MGKIFDALEKSTKEGGGDSFTPRNSKSGEKGSSNIKDVPRESFFNAKTGHPVDQNLITLLKPQSFEAERFKILKTSLLFPASGTSPKVIMVSSAVPGEGKSFVAANLAVSIAQNIDEHVLLMDCDLRLPSIHKRFGYGQTAGLSEYLAGKVSLESVFLKTRVEKLSIVPGGKPPHNPSELISSENMTRLLDEVKNRYEDRYIIIDTAPPQLASETSVLSKLVDGILVVIQYGKTKREVISDAVNMLGKKKILGVVFNHYDFQASSYYGDYSKYRKYFSKD